MKVKPLSKPWAEAKKRYSLTPIQVVRAKFLGLDPARLRRLPRPAGPAIDRAFDRKYGKQPPRKYTSYLQSLESAIGKKERNDLRLRDLRQEATRLHESGDLQGAIDAWHEFANLAGNQGRKEAVAKARRCVATIKKFMPQVD